MLSCPGGRAGRWAEKEAGPRAVDQAHSQEDISNRVLLSRVELKRERK